MSSFFDQLQQQTKQMQESQQAQDSRLSHLDKAEREKIEMHQRKLKRLNSLQWSPVSSLPMNMFMMWMAGNEIQMFSIIITGMALYQPIVALKNVGVTFLTFTGDESVKSEVWRCKCVYIVMCLVAFGVGLWKLQGMGLLPTGAADWVDRAPPVYTYVTAGGRI